MQQKYLLGDFFG